MGSFEWDISSLKVIDWAYLSGSRLCLLCYRISPGEDEHKREGEWINWKVWRKKFETRRKEWGCSNEVVKKNTFPLCRWFYVVLVLGAQDITRSTVRCNACWLIYPFCLNPGDKFDGLPLQYHVEAVQKRCGWPCVDKSLKSENCSQFIAVPETTVSL